MHALYQGRECACEGKTLDRLLRPAILGLLVGGPEHGYRIVRRLQELRLFARSEPDPTGVYRTLRSLDEEGWLSSSWQTAGRGVPRRMFELTDAGRACLDRWIETIDDYGRSIRELERFLKRSTGKARRGVPRRRRDS